MVSRSGAAEAKRRNLSNGNIFRGGRKKCRLNAYADRNDKGRNNNMKRETEMAFAGERLAATEAFAESYLLRKAIAGAVADDGGEENCETSKEVKLSRPAPFHPFPGVGQIRLLSQTDETAYVVVARKWGEHAFLVIPFSAYGDPATDLEFKTRFDGGNFLQVLQVWNARTLEAETLRKTWHVGMLNRDDLEDAMGLWHYSVGGDEPGEEAIRRTGIPIASEEDIRIGYQDEVLENFSRIDREDMLAAEARAEAEEKGAARANREWDPKALRDLFMEVRGRTGGAGMQLAAAGVERPVAVECTATGFDGTIRVKYDKKAGSCELRAFDGNGKASVEMDGWLVLGVDGETLGSMKGNSARFEIEGESPIALALLDYEGNVHAIEPKS